MRFFDKLKAVFQQEATPPKAAVPQGEVGLASESSIYSGKDFAKWNPDLLISYKGQQVYDKMLTDDQVKAVLEFKIGAVVSRGWFFDCEEEETEEGEEAVKEQHEEIKEFFGTVINRMDGSFIDKLIEILSALKYGFTVAEKIFTPIEYDGKTYWGVKDIKVRPFSTMQSSFVVDKHGNMQEVVQVAGAQRIVLPLEKIIHFVHRPEIDRHYGESDLRAAYRAWWSKDIAIKFQNIHLERAAGGFIWAQIDGSKGTLTTGDKANLEKVLSTLSAQSGIHVPASVALNAIQPLRTDAYEKAVAQHDKSIAKALLVPNLLGLSEQGDTGSYSQSEVHLQVFFWILDLIALRLEEVLNEQLFKQLSLWNFGTDDYPHFRFEPISEQEKAKISETWGNLIQKGAVTKSETDEAYLRKILGFPEKAEDEEEVESPEEILPEDSLPVEQPENEDWIDTASSDSEQKEKLKKEFAEKPWLNRCNFAAIEKTMTDNDSALSKSLSSIMAKVKLNVIDQIVKIGGERSWGNVSPLEIVNIKIPKTLLTAFRKSCRDQFQDTIDESYSQARKELPKKQFAKVAPGMDKTQTEKFMASKSMKITGVVENAVLSAVQSVLENSIKYDKSLKDTIRAIEEDTNLVSLLPEVDAAGRAVNVPARIENIARTNVSDAVNQARMALFTDPDLKGFVQAFEYSAILDDRTTEICSKLNGNVKVDWGSYAPPNHYQCRSLLIPVTQVDDWDGKDYRIPSTVQPMKGFA